MHRDGENVDWRRNTPGGAGWRPISGYRNIERPRRDLAWRLGAQTPRFFVALFQHAPFNEVSQRLWCKGRPPGYCLLDISNPISTIAAFFLRNSDDAPSNALTFPLPLANRRLRVVPRRSDPADHTALRRSRFFDAQHRWHVRSPNCRAKFITVAVRRNYPFCVSPPNLSEFDEQRSKSTFVSSNSVSYAKGIRRW